LKIPLSLLKMGGKPNVLFRRSAAARIIGKPHHSYRDKPFPRSDNLP